MSKVTIANGTCYSTDDLEKLVENLIESLWVLKRKSRIGWAPNPGATLRCGYYQPSAAPKEAGYVRVHDTKRGIRIGIVRTQHLPFSPLEHLAGAACDEMVVPKEVVQALVRKLCVNLTGYYLNDLRRHIPSAWEWIDTFKLRYGTRVKRGHGKHARREGQLNKLESLRSKIRSLEHERIRLELKLQENKANQENMRDDYRRRAVKLGVSPEV